MKPRELPIFNDPKARAVLDAACRKHNVTVTLLRELVEIQRQNVGRGVQLGITGDFEECIRDFLDRRSGSE